MTPPNKVAPSPVLFLWLGLGFFLATLGAAVAFNLHLEHDRTANRERDRLTAGARVIAENLERQLASANLALEGVRDGLRRGMGQAELRAEMSHLKAIGNAMPGVRYLSIMDREGTLVASNDLPQFIGRNFSYRDYFRAVRQHPDAGTLYVSPPYRSLLGTHVINVTRMIPDARGEFAGIVTATLDPEYFRTLMASVLYAPDMWDAIAHGDGLLFLMVPEREGTQGMNLARPGTLFTRHRDSGQTATVLTGTVYATGEMRMLAQRTIHPGALRMDKPLGVALSRDLDAVFQPWRHAALMQSGLYGLVAILSVSGLYAYQRRQRRFEQMEAESRVQINRLSNAMDCIAAFVYMKDRQRRYVYANRPTLELFGCSAEELRGSADSRFFPPETVTRLHAVDTRVLENGEDTAEEIVSRAADGSQRIYWEVKTPIYDSEDSSRIWGLCGISTDITERRRQEAALQESEERFRSTFDSAAIGMALVSTEGRFMEVNGALCGMVGYTRTELRQKTFQDITHPDDLEADLSLMQELLAGIRTSYQIEKRYFHKDGHVIWVLLSGSAVRGPDGKVLYFVAQVQDITERKALLDKLRLQAHQDYLTGLSNRRHFLEQGEMELSRARRYGKPISLFMLDIDRFKEINDTHGHKAGDTVLQKLSDILRKTLRTVDILGRMGGEEFAILLPETGLQEAADVAERLRKIIAHSDVALEAGLPLHFSVSIGVAAMREKDINIDMLLNLADKALYQAKNAGRNKVCLAGHDS